MRKTVKFIPLLVAAVLSCGLPYSCTDGLEPETPGSGGGNGDDGGGVGDSAVEETGELIWFENLDKVEASGSNWANFPGNFVNPAGSGSANLTYGCSLANSSVRSSYPSTTPGGYSGASGLNNIYFGSGTGWVSIAGIALDPEEDTYELSFGAYQMNKVLSHNAGNLKVFVGDRLNGRAVDVVWSGPKMNNVWSIASAVLKFEGEVPAAISLTFEANTNNIRIDDFKLTVSGKTPTQTITEITSPDIEPDVPPVPPTPVLTAVYYEDFDKVLASGNQWNNFPGGFTDPQGTGVAGLAYGSSSSNVSVRSSWPSTNSGYTDASGDNNVYFGVLPEDNIGWISVAGIALDPTKDTYELSFGSYIQDAVFDYASGNFKVYAGNALNSRAVEVLWSGPVTSGTWEIASAVLKFTRVPANLSLTFESNSNGIRIDDIRLVASDKTPTQTVPEFASGEGGDGGSGGSGGDVPGTGVLVTPYAEMPATLVESQDYKYVTHFANTYSSNKYVRNYSACYDIRRHNPMWVAYPFHSIYQEGGRSRPEPVDPWRPDPKFTENEQSIFYPSNWEDWPYNYSTDDRRRWDRLPGCSWNFGRGHLLMSADRGLPSSNNETLFEMNTQTFYPTNVSPENHHYPEHWTQIEFALCDDWNCSDTVYVVAGCHYANDNNVVIDDSWSGRTVTGKSKDCVVPTAHYKVFLRTKSGRTGKAVQDCSASELMAIGFWFEQKLDNNDYQAQPQISTITMSVAEIERKLGNIFDFFPNVPDVVKNSYNISDWPGLSTRAGKTWPAHEP